MKMTAIKILTVLLFVPCQKGYTQAFINLNFEDAAIVVDPSSSLYPHSVYASDALPGWTFTGNFQGQNDIFYDIVSRGSPSVSILDANGFPPALDGAFSVDLYGGGLPSAGVSLSQTGLVPASTVSIVFIAQGTPLPAGGPLLVSLGGQNISYSAISTGPNYTTYGGNITAALAGQTEQLTFTVPFGGNNYWEIDDIQFSPSSVPEPSAISLFTLVSLIFGWNFHRSRRGIMPRRSSGRF
jgi:hypothetical protein